MDIDYNLKNDLEEIVGYKIEPMTLQEDDVIGLLEDLVGKYRALEEELENTKQDLEDNYRPIPVAEQVGISDRDFMWKGEKMEENKVVLKLKEYIDLIEKVKELEQKLEYKDKNYVGMLNYVKDNVRGDANYHIKNFDGNIEDTMTNKIKNYNYKNIADSFMSKGITFDLAIELTDELLKERNINNE